jgi:flavorubredoxin
METLLLELKAHGLRDRTVACVENGTWAAQSARLIGDILGAMKEMRVLEQTVSLKSSVKEPQRQALESLADALAADILKTAD